MALKLQVEFLFSLHRLLLLLSIAVYSVLLSVLFVVLLPAALDLEVRLIPLWGPCSYELCVFRAFRSPVAVYTIRFVCAVCGLGSMHEFQLLFGWERLGNVGCKSAHAGKYKTGDDARATGVLLMLPLKGFKLYPRIRHVRGFTDLIGVGLILF